MEGFESAMGEAVTKLVTLLTGVAGCIDKLDERLQALEKASLVQGPSVGAPEGSTGQLEGQTEAPELAADPRLRPRCAARVKFRGGLVICNQMLVDGECPESLHHVTDVCDATIPWFGATSTCHRTLFQNGLCPNEQSHV